MSALDDVVRDGKVRFVGLSNFKLEEIEACIAVRRVDVVQYGWNMFDRRMQAEIFPYCATQQIGVGERREATNLRIRAASAGSPSGSTASRCGSSSRASTRRPRR